MSREALRASGVSRGGHGDGRRAAGAASVVGAIDSAITSVITARGSFGATQNGLVSRHELLREPASRRRDADLAAETAAARRSRSSDNMTAAPRSHRAVAGEQVLKLLRSRLRPSRE